jgi:hypothetical protein
MGVATESSRMDLRVILAAVSYRRESVRGEGERQPPGCP